MHTCLASDAIAWASAMDGRWSERHPHTSTSPRPRTATPAYRQPDVLSLPSSRVRVTAGGINLPPVSLDSLRVRLLVWARHQHIPRGGTER